MHRAASQALHCLALHLAGRTLTDRNRRLLEAAGSVEYLAELLLHRELSRYLDRAKQTLAELKGDSVISLVDDDYPSLLAEMSTAPLALFLRGNRHLLSGEKVSIVGTREPSEAGKQAASNVAAYYARKGRIVVSGIARGIDAITHHAALAAGGATIAVLPNGFDHLYPLENRDIYELSRTSERVLLISEYPRYEKPKRFQFVRRNRIIAGLSPATVVIEAGLQSGALITVGHALDAGRDVAALSHRSLTNNAGGEKLVSEGAIDLTALALGVSLPGQYG